MSDIGHNLPPDMADTAEGVMRDLSGWMAEHPAVQTEGEAREAKVFIDRGKLCIADLEAERTGKVAPLNKQVGEINEHYRQPRETLRRVLSELEHRVSGFLRLEEERRRQIVEAAQQTAAAAEALAREAERRERETLEHADSGELGLDVAAVTLQADAAFQAYQKAERQAVVAERDAKVKIGGGFARAVSLRTSETLIVTDIVAAVQEMKDSERIVEAVIKAARSYRKVFNKLPPGVAVQVERKI